jgi:hypothetical protein
MKTLPLFLVSAFIISCGDQDKNKVPGETNGSTITQSPCEKQLIADSALLKAFSMDFKKAVKSRDMKQIADFFVFPFSCSSCKALKDTTILSRDTLIDRQTFISTAYREFFGDWFMETVSKGFLDNISDSRVVNGDCQLFFSYPMSNPADSHTHTYFSLEKVRGRYMFTSSWRSGYVQRS